MNKVDLLVFAFVLLHVATFLTVIVWLGQVMIARNQVGDDQIRAKEKERKLRVPALILIGLLAASYVAIFILEATLSKQ